jgi:hypothetical protein
MSLMVSSGNLNGALAPLDFEHPILAAEFADALISLRRTGGLSDGTAYQYRRALINLLRGLSEQLPRTASLATPGASVVDAFHMGIRVGGAYPPESGIPYKYGTQIRALVRACRKRPRRQRTHAAVGSGTRLAPGRRLHTAG